MTSIVVTATPGTGALVHDRCRDDVCGMWRQAGALASDVDRDQPSASLPAGKVIINTGYQLALFLAMSLVIGLL